MKLKITPKTKIALPATIIERLGTAPDRILAEEANVSIQTIYSTRTMLNISPCGKHTFSKNRKVNAQQMERLVAQLGFMRDSVLSREFGISREYVRQLRQKYNVPTFSKFNKNNN
jgi:hypothetical protein